MSAHRNDQGEKWCTHGGGHWADPSRFYRNAAKPDGLNDIYIYNQGKVDQRNRR